MTELELFHNQTLVVIGIFAVALGASLGSFANVVIHRLPRKESIVTPPSACPKCKRKIKPWDNIPILSWLFLRGKCRHCKTPISPQYVIIEAISGIMALVLACVIFPSRMHLIQSYGDMLLLLGLFSILLLFAITLLTLAVIDWLHTELPPEICYPLAAVGLLTAYIIPIEPAYLQQIVGNLSLWDAALGAVLGGGIIFSIIALYYVLTKRIGMGGGDIGIMTLVGAFLGWQSLLFILLAASLQGIVAAMIGIVFGKRQQKEGDLAPFRNEVLAEDEEQAVVENAKLAIPFGPFIALAALEYLFLAPYILPWMTAGLLTPWGLVSSSELLLF